MKSIIIKRNFCGEIINIGSGKQYKLAEMVKIIENISKREINILWNTREESRQMEYKNWKCLNVKASKSLGWNPRTSIEKGLGYSLDWFKQFSFLYK